MVRRFLDHPNRELEPPAAPVRVIALLRVQLGQSVSHEVPVVRSRIRTDSLHAAAEGRSRHRSKVLRHNTGIQALKRERDRIPTGT